LIAGDDWQTALIEEERARRELLQRQNVGDDAAVGGRPSKRYCVCMSVRSMGMRTILPLRKS